MERENGPAPDGAADVTPIAEQTAARRRAERRVELLSAFARGIICEFDAECRYRDVWATDERLLAMPADQLIGRTIAEALGEEIGRPLMEATERVHRSGIPETQEYTLSLEVGLRTFEAEIVRIRHDTEFEPVRAAALIRDVTEQRAVERRLAEAERLAGLGLLAAGIGHEINNPLMVIQETARIAATKLGSLASGPHPIAAEIEPLRTMMADVLAGVQRMQGIVSDLRLFRREADDTRSAVDVRATLATALDMTQRQIEMRARLERDIAATPLISGSRGKLCQIFVNLLMNATQAIADGAPQLQAIRVRTATDPRGWAIVEVVDTGCGIPPEELGRIFDPFFTTKREGMGLGLSICERIVTSWGGTISVESELGRGTVFRIALPPAVGEATSADRTVPPDAPVQAPPRRKRLLIIDDEPVLLRVLSLALSDDHEVVTACGCDDAMRILTDDTRFDAVLCDLMMPVRDGVVFYERVAREAQHLLPRVVFMTGGAFTDRAWRFLQSVSNKTLEKPFGPPEVEQILETLAS
jgi:signal transduction histidine kinase